MADSNGPAPIDGAGLALTQAELVNRLARTVAEAADRIVTLERDAQNREATIDYLARRFVDLERKLTELGNELMRHQLGAH